RFGAVSPQDAHVGDPERPVNAREVLNDRSGAENRAEDLRDRPRFPQLTRWKSQDNDVSNSLPSPRRTFDRNAGGPQSFADFLTWVAVRDADRKRWVVFHSSPKGPEVK